MTQRGGFRGGYKGRGRPSPYSWRDRDRPKPWQKEEGEASRVQETAEEVTGVNHGGDAESRRVKKFSNKARLFVGNLPRDFSEEEMKKLFEPHGEVQEVYIHKEKNFGFVRMAYRTEAEKAIAATHGKLIKGRDIKVRFAASSCSVKVSNLHPLVSNEFLAEAFSHFGEVESAVVVTDERGKSLGYGIVDFARKAHAISAIQRCKNEQFLLTKTPIPVMVTELIRDNDEEGQPEKSIPKGPSYYVEREVPPRFAQPGTLEYNVAARWKAHYEYEKSQREELEQQLKQTRNQLQSDMEHIKEEHQTMMIRQEIARHQQEQLRLAGELRKQEERLHVLQQVPPGMPPIPLQSLFAQGGKLEGASMEGEAGIPPSLIGQDPHGFPGGGVPPFHPPPVGPGAFVPPPLMGQLSYPCQYLP